MSGEPDLNWRPLPWQGSVLPLNYRRERSERWEGSHDNEVLTAAWWLFSFA